VDRTYVIQVRDDCQPLVNTVMKLRVPEKDREYLSISFSRKTLLHGISYLNEAYSKVCISNSDALPIQIGVKQGDILSPLLYNFFVQYAIRKVQEYQKDWT
jgi:hypothetical protein